MKSRNSFLFQTIVVCFLSLSLAESSFGQSQPLECKNPPQKKTSCSLKKDEQKASILGDAAAIKKECEKQKVSLAFAKAAAEIGVVYKKSPVENMLKQNLEYYQSAIKSYEKKIETLQPFVKNFQAEKNKFESEKKAYIKKSESLLDAFYKTKNIEKKQEFKEAYFKLYEISEKFNLDIPETEAELSATLKTSEEKISEFQSKKAEKEIELAELIAKSGKTSEDDTLIASATSTVTQRANYVKEGSKFRDCGLTDEEIAAIHWYTGSKYKAINGALRSKDPERVKKFQPLVDAINSGLEKLKPVTATVKRGADLPDKIASQHCKGCVVVYDAFTSTSTTTAFDTDSKFEIISKSGRYVAPLSDHKDEEEVLFKPGAKFKVINIQKKNGITHYTMEEVE